MKSRLVIVDVDDVLIDLNKNIKKRINKMGYTDYKVENIKTYDLNKDINVSMLPEKQRSFMDNGLGCPRELILSCYSDVESFYYAPIVKNAYEGLKLLSDKFDVLIHTSSYNMNIIRFKMDLFESKFKNLRLDYNFCCGKEKPAFNNVFAVFEDSIPNIVKYDDETIKLLVDRPQNCELFNNDLLSKVKNINRVENFYTGVQYLLKEC